MISRYAHHFYWDYLDCTILWKPDIFKANSWVLYTLCSFEMRYAQSAMKHYWPYLLFFEDATFLISDDNFIGQTVINILEDEDDFIEGGAEGVVYFGICFLQIEDILVFGGEFSWEFEEGLLEGFFWGVGVFLDEVHGFGVCLLIDFSYW